MSINEHNLNIHLYSLEDLLGLFNLTYDITHEDLKRAKKTVLMTHPDKSKLDSKYFLFYKKAFDIIIRFHDNQNKQRKQVNPQNTIYSTNDDKDSSNTKNVTSIINDMSKKDFQHKFNDLFEKNMSKKIDTTKNEWFQNDESTFKTTENVNASNMGTIFNTIKDKQSGLVRYRGVENLVTKNTNSSNYYDDIEDDDSYVVSDPFSKLKFDDLRKVHKDQTVFDVSEKDIHKVQQFSSVDHMMRERGKQSLTPLEKQEAERILAQQNTQYREQMMQKEYADKLKTMQYEEKNKSVLSTFMLLKND